MCSAHERSRTQPRAGRRSAQSFFTWSKPTSTGVSRPKMDTSTFRRAASSLISEISPEKSERGPETTLTDSPIANWARVRVAVATSLCNSRSTSPWVSGTGSWEEPTKPVTPGVPLTTPQESSLSSMLTSTYPGIVRFSTGFFWLSFISMTVSVGTTTLRTARCWPSDTTRCSRLCLTLFSCPEYVLTTYQRNIQTSEDEFDDFLGDRVGQAEVGAGDGDEADDDGGRLRDLAAVGPLYALELRPARAEEADRAIAAAQRRAGGLLGRDDGAAAAAPRAGGCVELLHFVLAEIEVQELNAASGAGSGGAPRAGGCVELLHFVLAEIALTLGLGLDFLLGERVAVGRVGGDGHALGAAHERGVELVDLARGVVERAGHVGAQRLAGGRNGRGHLGGLPAAAGRRGAAFAALLCTFAVTGHSSAPALTGLPMAGVSATPAAVLAQRDPIGVVALALVRLVVAMLALLAGEGDSDSDISAGHV